MTKNTDKVGGPGAASGPKVNAAASGKKPTAGKDDDSDDPIAQAMALRIKAGGVTSVVSAPDAKKAGVKQPTPAQGAKDTAKPTDKITRPQTAVTQPTPATDKKSDSYSYRNHSREEAPSIRAKDNSCHWTLEPRS